MSVFKVSLRGFVARHDLPDAHSIFVTLKMFDIIRQSKLTGTLSPTESQMYTENEFSSHFNQHSSLVFITLPCFPESTFNICPVTFPLHSSLAKNKILFATLSGGTGFFNAVLILLAGSRKHLQDTIRRLCIKPILIWILGTLFLELCRVHWSRSNSIDSSNYQSPAAGSHLTTHLAPGHILLTSPIKLFTRPTCTADFPAA